MRRMGSVSILAAGAGIVAVAVLSLLARLHQSFSDPAGTTFDLVTVGRRRRLRYHSTGLTGGTILAIGGSVTVDLRATALATQGAFVEIDCWAGRVEVIVPEGWHVVVYRQEWFGGATAVDAEVAPGATGSPTLEVEARVFAGRVVVRTERGSNATTEREEV